jgi:hypothetical protein
MPVALDSGKPGYGQFAGTVSVTVAVELPSVIDTAPVVGNDAPASPARRVIVIVLPEATAVTRGWVEFTM